MGRPSSAREFPLTQALVRATPSRYKGWVGVLYELGRTYDDPVGRCQRDSRVRQLSSRSLRLAEFDGPVVCGSS